ncbi:MAG: PKD domain-containing protein, partial [Bacteroidales bacterium]|nr:PKD domain-containing protein [Bacteroidales bacterium]
ANDCDNFLIEGCVIDRRYTGLKFGFIHNGNDNGFGNDGIIRDCIFYPPKDTIGAPSAGGAIFLYDGDSIIIERTKIIGTDRIYSYDAGVGGQLSFDNVIMNYVLGDSVHNFQVSIKNNYCYLNNVTFTTNHPNTIMLDVSGGLTYMTNCALACGPNTTATYGVTGQSNNIIYVGDHSNWNSTFGWTDWASGNYHLQSTSPLVDVGSDVNLHFDLDSLPVPFGIAPDIGCYEYQSGTGMAPVPDFYTPDTVINAGESIQFFDQSLYNPNQWVWFFEGGYPFQSNLQNPIVQYNSSGIYNVILVASNNAGNDVLVKYNYIEVYESFMPPSVKFNASDTIIPIGDSITFIDMSSNLPKSWKWGFQEGSPSTSLQQNPTITFNSVGEFNVVLIATNSFGFDFEVKSKYIQVYDPSIPLNTMVDIKAMLEGPFDGIEMLTLLNDDGYLPFNQPYNIAPWNYSGGETVSFIPNENVVDWILVELRDAVDVVSATSASVIERKAGFILMDGSIVAIDGSSNLQFNNSPSFGLFVVIYHRNHLPVISNNVLTLLDGVYTYNFSSGANQAYNNGADGQKEITSGIWAMYGGDADGGGEITNFDNQMIWRPCTGTTGYTKADYNLDGEIDNKDKNEVWAENFGIGTQVPE